MFCFDFHVLCLEFKHDFAIVCLDFFVPWKSLCLCNFCVCGNFNNCLKHRYISKPIIFNISSIYHFKTCEIKHWLHMLLVIIVNSLENDYVNQITDLLIDK